MKLAPKFFKSIIDFIRPGNLKKKSIQLNELDDDVISKIDDTSSEITFDDLYNNQHGVNRIINVDDKDVVFALTGKLFDISGTTDYGDYLSIDDINKSAFFSGGTSAIKLSSLDSIKLFFKNIEDFEVKIWNCNDYNDKVVRFDHQYDTTKANFDFQVIGNNYGFLNTQEFGANTFFACETNYNRSEWTAKMGSEINIQTILQGLGVRHGTANQIGLGWSSLNSIMALDSKDNFDFIVQNGKYFGFLVDDGGGGWQEIVKVKGQYQGETGKQVIIGVETHEHSWFDGFGYFHGAMLYSFGGNARISLGYSSEVIKFYDSNLSAYISLSESGVAAWDVWFDKASIVGNINELALEKTDLLGNKDIEITDTTKGIILRDAQATPHKWRVTIDNTGTLVTTDIGVA